VVLLALGVLVLVPLAREFAELRRSGLGRIAALGVTSLVAPAFAVGFVLSLPLASRPALQWTVLVAGTLVAYSLAVRAILASASSAGTAPSRRT
jgi:hypothetical protein